eukprot:XP_014774625.1 PREDICTED: fibroblast growth factor 18-like isoform X1 [Octopus bimaculoides]
MISLPYPTIKRFHLDHNRLLWLLLPFVFVLVQSDINVLNNEGLIPAGPNRAYATIPMSYNYSAYLARHKSVDINQKFQSPQTVLIRSRCSDEFIELGPSGKIRAEGSENSEHASLTIQYGPFGMVRIRGSENKYMCFNQKGRLILRRNPKIFRCIFVARMMNGTYIFQLASFQRWAVGFRKNGRPLRGHKYSTQRRKCFEFYLRVRDSPKENFSPIKDPIFLSALKTNR